MNLYKTKAVVLKDYDLKDQDKIVVFCSLKYGKIRLIVKGGRKIKSKFAPAIQPPSYLNLLVYQNTRSGLDILSESQVMCPFLGIRRDLVKFAYSSYLAELIIKLSAEREALPDLFRLLLKTLSLIEKSSKKDLDILIHSFELKLLDILGYRPSLEDCVYCGEKIERTNFLFFSIIKGGVICRSCEERDRKRLTISQKTLGVLKSLLYLNLERSAKLIIDEKTQKEIKKILEGYLLYRIESKMLTPSFIDNFKILEKVMSKVYGSRNF